MDNEKIKNIFKKTGALLEGHFVLTSGLHSNQYFQCAKVLQYPEYNVMFGSEIAEHFKDDRIDVVISPAVGGIVIGTETGRQLSVKTIFAERENGKMTLRRGFSLNAGERVLVVEDVVTTGGSIFEVMEAVKTFGGITAGVAYIVDRSNGKVKFGVKQFSLTKLEAVQYKAEEIPDWLSKIPVTKPGSRNLK